jgi:hypothetical protein
MIELALAPSHLSWEDRWLVSSGTVSHDFSQSIYTILYFFPIRNSLIRCVIKYDL